MIAPAVAVKVVVVAPAGTVTEAGAVSAVTMLLERATSVPPAGAALEIVTVQVVDADGASETLAHDRELTESGGITEIASDLTAPFRVALRFEVWLLVTAAAVAVKEAALSLPGTSTEAGTVNAVVTLLASATVVPPAGVILDSITMQLVVAGPVSVVLVQVRELTAI
jgi:hypothetical protein